MIRPTPRRGLGALVAYLVAYKRALIGEAILLAAMTLPSIPTAHAQAQASPRASASSFDALGRVTGTISPDPDGSEPPAAPRSTIPTMPPGVRGVVFLYFTPNPLTDHIYIGSIRGEASSAEMGCLIKRGQNNTPVRRNCLAIGGYGVFS
jgi:hypothetical protein